MVLLVYYRPIELLIMSDNVLLGTAKYKGLCNSYAVYKTAVIWILHFKKKFAFLEGRNIIYVSALRKPK